MTMEIHHWSHDSALALLESLVPSNSGLKCSRQTHPVYFADATTCGLHQTASNRLRQQVCQPELAEGAALIAIVCPLTVLALERNLKLSTMGLSLAQAECRLHEVEACQQISNAGAQWC